MCSHCQKIGYQDLLDLVAKFGPNTNLGQLRRRAICGRCHRRNVIVLTKLPNRRDGDPCLDPASATEPK
jgi:hypothetical protein